MDKLKMQTPDLTDKNIEQIAQLFPNVITETRDENGAVKKAVDFDLLKQVLSKNLVEDDNERYRLDWPGKKASLLKANTPITKTLRPCREESVNFDTTENLYIEGDNFEVLKILQESYLGKVKMIDIDPPYNTGNDFIYKDNFKQSKEEYEEELGTTNEDGGKLFKNTDSNGRFHSDWLSMMYERLVVARDLLRDDGVIFIHIDDNEVSNLRKLCDEIFGEENFVSEFPRVTKKAGKSTDNIAKNNDYILCFQKSNKSVLNSYTHTDEGFKHSDEYESSRGVYKLNQTLDYGSIQYSPSLDYEIEIEGQILRPGNVSKAEMEARKKRNPKSDFCWRWSKDLYDFGLRNGFIVLKESKDGYRIYTKTYENATISKGPHGYLIEEKARTKSATTLDFIDNVYSNDNSRKDLSKVFEEHIFEYSKPVSLIKALSFLATEPSDIILDFFSGSGTTAHAVLDLNKQDNGNRKFIMVQLPEKTDENSEAYKAGYKTIAEIGKERIRRAGKKIVEEHKSKTQQLKFDEEPVDASKLDIGFRVYKTDDTNMKDVFYHPAELDQKQLSFVESNIKEDRTPEDLLTQVVLDLGLELSLPIETKKILGNTVYIVQTNALVACFDNDIDFKIVDAISDLKPFKVVFKDASFKDDKDRINVEERFKRLSPETKVTVI